ncbi:hypothetical protein [Bacillus litorisediminis]|uniref:hypothetical protein n=1 Tax=Bacillus litorisediminis TaxID=2922713 RepID=UPI001FAFC2A7|nr:hypothetical protein [Bacillus litorisediminis]
MIPKTYWEKSVEEFYTTWRERPTPLTHPEHYRKANKKKKLLTIDDLKPLIQAKEKANNGAKRKTNSKRSRTKKKVN